MAAGIAEATRLRVFGYIKILIRNLGLLMIIVDFPPCRRLSKGKKRLGGKKMHFSAIFSSGIVANVHYFMYLCTRNYKMANCVNTVVKIVTHVER